MKKDCNESMQHVLMLIDLNSQSIRLPENAGLFIPVFLHLHSLHSVSSIIDKQQSPKSKPQSLLFTSSWQIPSPAFIDAASPHESKVHFRKHFHFLDEVIKH